MTKTNLRSIDNIEINDMNFKHLETTKDIVISPKNKFGNPQWLDTTHTWSAKVSDGNNYVGDYKAKVNATSIVVNSSDFTKLPVGNYQLEVWEEWTDTNGESQLSIYPSPQQTIPFTICANVTDQAAKEIKEIGFQDVVDQAVMNIGMNYVFKVNTIEPDQTATVVQAAADGKNYVTFNIPQGKTGEQGFRGPAGKAFHIQQTFASAKDMEASQGQGFDDGDFAMIASTPDDPDNSKLYVWADSTKKFTYINDLSGATGIQGPDGPAPTLHVTKVTSLPSNEAPTFNLVPVSDGNYNVEVGIPKGEKGDPGKDGYTPVRGTDYWTDADQKAIKDDVNQMVGDATSSLNVLTANSIHWSNIDLTNGYDPNKWYPVISSSSSVNQLDKVIVKKSLYNGPGSKPAPWGTRNDKHVPCMFDLLVSGNGYGTLPTMAYLFANQARFTDKSPIAFDVLAADTKYLLWLRGGTDYEVGISLPSTTWEICKDSYTTVNKMSVVPTTELPTNLNLAKESMDTIIFIDLQKLAQ